MKVEIAVGFETALSMLLLGSTGTAPATSTTHKSLTAVFPPTWTSRAAARLGFKVESDNFGSRQAPDYEATAANVL